MPPQAPGGPAPPRYRPARVPVEPPPGRRRIPVAPGAANRSPPAQPPPGRVGQRVAEPHRQGRAAGAPHRDPPPPRGSRPTPARPVRRPPRVPPTGSTEPRAHPGRNRPAAGRNRRLRRRTSSCRPQTAGTCIPTSILGVRGPPSRTFGKNIQHSNDRWVPTPQAAATDRSGPDAAGGRAAPLCSVVDIAAHYTARRSRPLTRPGTTIVGSASPGAPESGVWKR